MKIGNRITDQFIFACYKKRLPFEQPFPEFDTLYALRPLKPNTSAGCSSKFEKVVGRKLFGKTDGTHYFWGLWHFYVRR
jgi:hypothetical protein